MKKFTKKVGKFGLIEVLLNYKTVFSNKEEKTVNKVRSYFKDSCICKNKLIFDDQLIYFINRHEKILLDLEEPEKPKESPSLEEFLYNKGFNNENDSNYLEIKITNEDPKEDAITYNISTIQDIANAVTKDNFESFLEEFNFVIQTIIKNKERNGYCKILDFTWIDDKKK